MSNYPGFTVEDPFSAATPDDTDASWIILDPYPHASTDPAYVDEPAYFWARFHARAAFIAVPGLRVDR